MAAGSSFFVPLSQLLWGLDIFTAAGPCECLTEQADLV